MTDRSVTKHERFSELLRTVRCDMEFELKQMAGKLGISPQYLGDLEHERRKPSVRIVNAICKYMGCLPGSVGSRRWHAAAARAIGWDV